MALAVGDLSIRDVTETAGEGEELVGRVTLADGRTESFTMRAEKRPDPTPLFATMNAIAARQGAGRFIAVASAGEGLIVVWLRPEEKIAFPAWADMQYCAAGPARRLVRLRANLFFKPPLQNPAIAQRRR
ncbi:hypothetical protein [Methylocystis sp. S23]